MGDIPRMPRWFARPPILGVAFAIAGCGDAGAARPSLEPSSESSAAVVTSAAARMSDRPALAAEIRFEAIGMPAKIEKGADVAIEDKSPFALALEAQRAALVACHQGRPLTTAEEGASANTWFTARVSPEGRASDVAMAETNAPATSAKCVQRLIEKIDFGARPQPVALSVWISVADDANAGAAPPTATGAPSSPEASARALFAPPSPRPDCASDNVEAYLPVCSDPTARRGSRWGDPIHGAPSGGLRGEPVVSAGTPEVGRPGGGGRKRRHSPPQVRSSPPTVSGKLPVEVIQRIVRQNSGKFRLCYESALDHSPALEGTVTTGFVIGADGLVASVANAGSKMPDLEVVECVVRAFSTIRFPSPEAGVVHVTFPISFAPADGSVGVREAKSIRAIDLDELTGPALATALTRDKTRAVSVVGEEGGAVPFVVFADVVFPSERGARYALLRRPEGAPFAHGLQYTDGAFVVHVIPIGDAPLSSWFVD